MWSLLPPGSYSWSDAQQECQKLPKNSEFTGEWQLPSMSELRLFFDEKWKNVLGDDPSLSDILWTRSAAQYNAAIHLLSRDQSPKIEKDSQHFAICVSSAFNRSEEFLAINDVCSQSKGFRPAAKGCLDEAAGLWFSKPSERALTALEAKEYCRKLPPTSGFPWDIPEKKEMDTLLNHGFSRTLIEEKWKDRMYWFSDPQRAGAFATLIGAKKREQGFAKEETYSGICIARLKNYDPLQLVFRKGDGIVFVKLSGNEIVKKTAIYRDSSNQQVVKIKQTANGDQGPFHLDKAFKGLDSKGPLPKSLTLTTNEFLRAVRMLSGGRELQLEIDKNRRTMTHDQEITDLKLRDLVGKESERFESAKLKAEMEQSFKWLSEKQAKLTRQLNEILDLEKLVPLILTTSQLESYAFVFFQDRFSSDRQGQFGLLMSKIADRLLRAHDSFRYVQSRRIDDLEELIKLYARGDDPPDILGRVTHLSATDRDKKMRALDDEISALRDQQPKLDDLMKFF